MKLRAKRNIDLLVGQPLIWLLIPFARLFGLILNRDHELKINGKTLVLKMAGGGSLYIAYPALKALKEHSDYPIDLLCTQAVAPFAKTLGIFDRIIVLDGSGIFAFATTYLRYWLSNLFKYDTVINFEVHSRLATIISLFSLARNRIGYHRHDFNPFTSLNTHSFYFNLQRSIPGSYEEVAKAVGAKIPESKNLHESFVNIIKNQYSIQESYSEETYDIGIGAICSDLAPERMMPHRFWKDFIKNRIRSIDKPIRVFLYGAPGDKEVYQKMIEDVFKDFNIEVINAAGFKPLGETILHMHKVLDEYWGIDTSLLHISRLLGSKSYLFWGPTDPSVYLKDFDFLESKVFYQSVSCSPCVHLTRYPPCLGKNICMEFDFD